MTGNKMCNHLIVKMICFLIVLWMGCGIDSALASDQYSADLSAIKGRWVRTDAPYVIELGEAEGGALQAKYFNPRPIHVDKTETAEDGGLLYVMVRLKDVNYQGSMYLLAYDREKDILQGTYLHGGSQQTYAVGFVRKVGP